MRFIPAAFYTPTHNRQIDVIVIHDMEYPEKLTAAEDVAKFFHDQKDPKKGSSAHYCADENSIVRCVQDHNVAWAAPGANSNGLHFELAGFAKQDRKDWGDEYSLAMLEIVAELVARKAHQYDIRPRKIDASDLRAGRSGVCGHLDVTEAYPKLGSHRDPGDNFIWNHFMHRMHHYFGLHRSS